MLDIRRIGALILCVAAFIVLFGMAPDDMTGSGDITSVMIGDAANQDRAEGAPQQSVVNGWTARDLLEIIAKQGEGSRDDRPAALLTLVVLGLALALFTSSPGGGGLRQTSGGGPTATAPEKPADGWPSGDVPLSSETAKLPA
jgi:hypothetical protein